MHLRTGTRFEYDFDDERNIRFRARDYCQNWRDGEPNCPLTSLYNDYLDTESNDEKTPDPVSARNVVVYLNKMDKRYSGIETFEECREAFTEFRDYAKKVEQLENLRRDMQTVFIRAKRLYGEDYYHHVQGIFREELDKSQRNER
ncbi:hypothetical protein EVB81_204 [Rhizobium phage RHph_I46]|uniref:Uncharacterized protein n=1 Tax=Rhizobium phage RHph_I1_9 TaxID=2509729 RepID=A0A7S5RIP0_9CAUD|nr:hypothetical protein PP936_gp202 [Rhizobium phage RHph_I1_9]QIG69773.1 hypothetical protein EVB81_204 [Rhizobium phage RHph_I46]QIG71054.1 hypothetical protein EVB92_204 [Rhizobium phage RHph_I9]QIG73639.1 hypothetical protein EVC04_202 [Rhizobium phage RHph_I1_9]QIG76393.1 hypothetical protein EVC25_204 [Rhizobium phage RHph_I34]